MIINEPATSIDSRVAVKLLRPALQRLISESPTNNNLDTTKAY